MVGSRKRRGGEKEASRSQSKRNECAEQGRADVHPVEEVLVAPVLPEAAPLTLAAALDVESRGALGVVALAADEGLHPVVGDESDVVPVVLGAGVLDPGEVGGGELLSWRVLHREVAYRLHHILLRHLRVLPHPPGQPAGEIDLAR